MHTWIVNLKEHTLVPGYWISLFCDTIARSANFNKLPDVHTWFL